MGNTENLTARERMRLDMVYDDFDADLFNRRVTAKTLFKAFIQTLTDRWRNGINHRKLLTNRYYANDYAQFDLNHANAAWLFPLILLTLSQNN